MLLIGLSVQAQKTDTLKFTKDYYIGSSSFEISAKTHLSTRGDVTEKQLLELFKASAVLYGDTAMAVNDKYYKSSTGTYIDSKGKLHIVNPEQEILNLISQLLKSYHKLRY